VKTARYLAIAAAVIAAIAAIAWYLRDSIIRQASGPLLGKYGLVITDVSLDALATSDAAIGYLELQHASGTTIAIENLRLPITASPSGLKSYAAGVVTVVLPAASAAEPVALAPLIEQLLALPDWLPGTEISIDEMHAAPYPVVRNIHWIADSGEQRLEASLPPVKAALRVTAEADARQWVQLRLAAAGAKPQLVEVHIDRVADGIEASGSSAVDLNAWAPVLASLRLIPDGVAVTAGSAAMTFDISIPDALGSMPSVTASATPLAPIHLSFGDESGGRPDVTMESGSAITLDATFPGGAWAVHQDHASLVLSYGSLGSLSIGLGKLDCRSGLNCSVVTDLSIESAHLGDSSAAQIRLCSSQNIAITDEATQLQVEPGATLRIEDLDLSGRGVDLLELQLVEGATAKFAGNDWQFAADSIDATLTGLTLGDNVSASAPLSLEKLAASGADARVVARARVSMPSAAMSVGSLHLASPGLRGKLALDGPVLEATLSTSGLFADGEINASANLAEGSGQLQLRGASLSFASATLADRVRPWGRNWNLTDGTLALDLDAAWAESARLRGNATIHAANLAGYYSDTAIAGGTTTLAARYDSIAGLRMDPAHLSVALVDMGIPVKNLAADYTLYPDEPAVDVENLQMSAFGGSVYADPFSFHTGSGSNTLLVHAKSLQLAELLTVNEIKAIEVTGKIGGDLPVTIANGGITVENGNLDGEPPGGVIRYLPGIEAEAADVSGIGIATRALSNFEYETLTAAVEYSAAGDLRLQMQLKGRNPDLDDGRPVVLNLGVENNVPQLLRSLQATRAVEEILQRRLQQ